MNIAEDRLYVCIEEGNKLSMHTRDEIDDVIQKAEETSSGRLDFTSIGSINTQDITKKHFALLFTIQGKVYMSTLYDVVQADSAEQAQAIVEQKPRFQRKSLTFRKIIDLSELINQTLS